MMSVSCAMGVETLRGAASGVRAVVRPRSYTPGWVERAASHGQRAAAGLQEHEAREERRAERHQRQPAHDAHECAARAARRGGHEADDERPGGGEDAPDVVAKARAGGTQPRREELRQVEGEGAEDAVHAGADEEQHRQPRLRREDEAEGREQREGRKQEVSDEHRAATEALRERRRREGAEEPPEIEGIGSVSLPGGGELPGGCRKESGAGGVFGRERPPEERNEGVARPPREYRDDRREDPAQ